MTDLYSFIDVAERLRALGLGVEVEQLAALSKASALPIARLSDAMEAFARSVSQTEASLSAAMPPEDIAPQSDDPLRRPPRSYPGSEPRNRRRR